MTAINASHDTLDDSNLLAFLHRCDTMNLLGQFTLDAFYITSEERRKLGCKIEQHLIRPGYTINDYSLSPGVWQSFVTIRLCSHLIRIISTYVDNTKKSEIS